MLCTTGKHGYRLRNNGHRLILLLSSPYRGESDSLEVSYET